MISPAEQEALERMESRSHRSEDIQAALNVIKTLESRVERSTIQLVEQEEFERHLLAKCHDMHGKLGPHQFKSWLDRECLRVNALVTPKPENRNEHSRA